MREIKVTVSSLVPPGRIIILNPFAVDEPIDCWVANQETKERIERVYAEIESDQQRVEQITRLLELVEQAPRKGQG